MTLFTHSTHIRLCILIFWSTSFYNCTPSTLDSNTKTPSLSSNHIKNTSHIIPITGHKTALKGPLKKWHFFTTAMGTRWNLNLITQDPLIAQESARAAFNEIHRIEQKVSSWIANSEIGKLNLLNSCNACCLCGATG